jgi:hypothetical protein
VGEFSIIQGAVGNPALRKKHGLGQTWYRVRLIFQVSVERELDQT